VNLPVKIGKNPNFHHGFHSVVHSVANPPGPNGQTKFHTAIPASIPPLPFNQTTHPADGPVYRQSQNAWIGKYTFPTVVDLKFSLAFLTDFFTRIGISDRIATEWTFQIGGNVKGVHEKGMRLIFVCKNLNLILHTKR
jgi:hypothetical protein